MKNAKHNLFSIYFYKVNIILLDIVDFCNQHVFHIIYEHCWIYCAKFGIHFLKLDYCSCVLNSRILEFRELIRSTAVKFVNFTLHIYTCNSRLFLHFLFKYIWVDIIMWNESYWRTIWYLYVCILIIFCVLKCALVLLSTKSKLKYGSIKPVNFFQIFIIIQAMYTELVRVYFSIILNYFCVFLLHLLFLIAQLQNINVLKRLSVSVTNMKSLFITLLTSKLN